MENDQGRAKITCSEKGRRQKKQRIEVTSLEPSTSTVEEDPGVAYDNDGNETPCSNEELEERVASEAKKHVCILNKVFSWSLSDRSAARRATHALAELSKDGKQLISYPRLFLFTILFICFLLNWCLFFL